MVKMIKFIIDSHYKYLKKNPFPIYVSDRGRQLCFTPYLKLKIYVKKLCIRLGFKSSNFYIKKSNTFTYLFYLCCIFDSVFFLQRIFFFLLQNTINTFYNLFYDYWDLITKFWPGSRKWNTPFLYIISIQGPKKS